MLPFGGLKIFLLISLTIVTIAIGRYFLSGNRNADLSLANLRRRHPNRRNVDLVRLNKAQMKHFKKAVRLSKEQNHLAASKIFESIGLIRNAIEVLDRNGFVDEAAKTLLRIGKPDRAAAIFARHKMWKKAGDCYSRAKLHKDAGKAYLKAKKYEASGQCFLKSRCFLEAGEAFLLASDLNQAILAFIRENQLGKCSEILTMLVGKTEDLTKIDLSGDELLKICPHITKFDNQMIHLFILRDLHLPLISEFISRKHTSKIVQVLKLSTPDVLDIILSKTNFQAEESDVMASAMLQAGFYEHAGKIYEQRGDWREAANAYELAGELDRLAHCLRRLGIKPANSDSQSLSKVLEQINIPSTGEFVLKDFSKTRNFPKHSTVEIDISEPGSYPLLFSKPYFVRNMPEYYISLLWAQGTIRSYKTGENIELGEDTKKSIFIILAGSISVSYRDQSKDTIVKSGDPLNDSILFSEQKERFQMSSNSSSEAWSITLEALGACFRSNPDFATVFYKNLGKNLYDLTHRSDQKSRSTKHRSA